MELCRVCLSTNIKKDISELVVDDENIKDFDIIAFCLGIKITEDTKAATKLCTKCFKKIVEFYKFKTLALNTNLFLKSNNNLPIVKVEKLECDVILEDGPVLKEEVVKHEDSLDHTDFDDMFLSVIKDIKDENIHEEITEIDKDTIKIKHKHKKKKSKSKSQVCDECGKSVVHLAEHMRIHLPKEQRTVKIYPCKICNKKFKGSQSRRKHILVTHEGKKQECPICKKAFVSLWAHQLSVHNVQAKPFSCSWCDKRFLSRSILAEHILRHQKEKPFECDQCDAKLSSSLSLRNHLRQVHNKERTHICEFCSKTFCRKDSLLVHIRTHTKERPYPCKQCDKGFASASGLSVHMTVHTGDKKFKCPHCDMAFARNGNLWKHVVCHTKKKKYPCKYCGVSFYRSDHRKRHQFTAHEKIQALDTIKETVP